MTARVLKLKLRRSSPGPHELGPIPAARLGKMLTLAPDGVLVEVVPGTEGVLARLALPIDRPSLVSAIAAQQAAVLVFEDGDAARPIIVGILGSAVPESKHEAQPLTVEADLDGQCVRVEAQQKIVLQCGKASITLRRDGKIVLRGSSVESHASGTNRITGGNVRIN